MKALIYWAEMVCAPVIAIALLLISPQSAPARLGLFVAGMLIQSLAEYGVHRFVLHGLRVQQHRLHHADPEAAIYAIFWPIWIGFLAAYALAGAAVVAGMLQAYAWYLWVHHCAHHAPHRLPRELEHHHYGHHRLASRNYGVSTTLWDWLFQTQRPDKET